MATRPVSAPIGEPVSSGLCDMSNETTNQPNVNLKPATEPVRNMFGKRSGQVKASLGDTGWTATAYTKQDALALLHADLSLAKEHEHTRRYIRVTGATFCLYWAGCWCYDIIHDDFKGGVPGSCMMSEPTLARAMARMEEHARQFDEQAKMVA